LDWLRYEIIWEKTSATGHLNAKKMPLKAHENILVFYKKLPTYNPQKTTGHKPVNNFIPKPIQIRNA
jgi:site-specific DNA-methyltransferase (adenine-specific)